MPAYISILTTLAPKTSIEPVNLSDLLIYTYLQIPVYMYLPSLFYLYTFVHVPACSILTYIIQRQYAWVLNLWMHDLSY